MPRGAPRLRTPEGKLNLVAARVRQRRMELKLTQDALCARLATVTDGAWIADRRDIFRIEDGRRSVHDLEIIALAEALYGREPCHFALHDALLEADESELAQHFREPEHPKGCWALDAILCKG